MSAVITSADDLRARIREFAATEPNPAVITDRVLRTLTGDEFRVVASVSLHEFVRRAVVSGGARETEAFETPSGAPAKSWKVKGIRDWVERELRQPLCVDESSATWKYLQECTAADCYGIAAIRGRKAAQNEAERDRFEGIGKAVEHAGVDTIGDLPRETLEAVLRR